jgi:hypothetical protein
LQEKVVSGPLAKTIENNLHALDVRVLDGLQCFVHFFHADAVVSQLAGLHHAIENIESFRLEIEFSGRAVELQQVERVGCEIAQAVFHPRGKIRSAVAGDRLLQQTPPGLGGDDDVLLVIFLQVGDQALAAAIAVHISGIEKIYAAIDSRAQRRHCFFVGDMAPRTANGPCTEADFRNFPTGAAQRAIFHV